jgi:hypothetical protein
MAGYTKEFLIAAFVSRYECLGLEAVEKCHKLAEACWDMYTKDQFRAYCSLDADAIKQYKEKLKQ